MQQPRIYISIHTNGANIAFADFWIWTKRLWPDARGQSPKHAI